MDSFIENTLNGLTYFCDRHDSLGEKIPINRIDYDIHVKYDFEGNPIFRYCGQCWNYMKLRTWVCDCGSRGKLRSSDVNFINCSCGRKCDLR